MNGWMINACSDVAVLREVLSPAVFLPTGACHAVPNDEGTVKVLPCTEVLAGFKGVGLDSALVLWVLMKLVPPRCAIEIQHWEWSRGRR
jgi:hypothetical protein